MAEAPEYINPIIQALIHAHQINQQRAELKAKTQQFGEENKLRQQQLDQQLRQIEYEHAHHTEQTRIQGEHQKLLADQAKANAILKSQESASAFGPSAAQASLEQLAPGLSQGIQFTNPQEQAQREAQRTAQLVTSQQTALQPFKEREANLEFENHRKLNEQQNTAASARLDKSLSNALTIARENRASAERIAQWHNATSMATAKLKMQDLESAYGDGNLSQAIEGAWLGTFDPDKLSTQKERTMFNGALANSNELGALPRGRAWIKYKENLDNFANLQDAINDARELAQDFSRDSPNATGNLSVGIPGTSGAIGMTMPGSPLKAKIDTLKSRVDPIVRQLQGDKRISDKDAERIFAGLFDPASRKADNEKRVDELIKVFQNAARSSFTGMSKDRKLFVFGRLGITDLLPDEEAKSNPNEIEYVRDKSGKLVRK